MTDYLVSTNPARAFDEVGRVPVSTPADVHAAVQRAKDAYAGWRDTPLQDRLDFFKKLLPLLERDAVELARLETSEMGKLITESLRSVKGNIERVRWGIENAADLLAPRLIEEKESVVEIVREPYGVVAAIVPWNFPVSQTLIPLMPALMSGNTMVLKHSEESPLISHFISKLMTEAGFPDGVFSVVFGGGDVGKQLLEEAVDFVYFTGSTKTGRLVYEKAAQKFIPAVLEMGGSSPGIIYDDADIQTACQSAFRERFTNCGQVCTALKRLIVQKNIFDVVVASLKTIAESQVVGDPHDEKTTIGPLSAERQLKLLEEQVADALRLGAKVVTGGKRPDGLDGAYFLPTILTDVTPEMRVMKEEVFGPVLPVVSFADDKEALAIANDTPYGLSAFVYSSDAARAESAARQILAGEVHINGASKGRRAPIGGYKLSGIGRADGEYGYFAMTQLKTIAKPR